MDAAVMAKGIEIVFHVVAFLLAIGVLAMICIQAQSFGRSNQTLLTAPSSLQAGYIGLLILYMIYHVTEIEAPPPAPAAPAMAGPAGRLRALLPVLDGAGKHYLWVALLMFSLNFTGFMTVPLVPDFLVHTLKLGDGIISVGSAVSSLIVFLISLFVARLARRTGNRRASVGGIILISAQFVILSQAHAPGLYLLSMVLGGIANGILASALYNYQLDVLPPADRTVWSSWNSMLGNGAALLGSIAGPAFAALTGTPQALLFLALARLVIGVVIWIWG